MTNVIQPHWPAPSFIKAYTTLRSMDVNFLPTQRNLLQTALALPTEPFWVEQTHGNVVLRASPENRDQKADATYTDQIRHICLVFTADCLPILICDRKGTHVAAVHAGWRGLVSGIIGKTIEALNIDPRELLVWIGPGISQPCYEVGDEVRAAFIQAHPDNATAFVPSPNQRWLADLYAIARMQLHQKGIQAIYGGDFCTYSDEERFFSYRRDGKKGRMATLIWIDA